MYRQSQDATTTTHSSSTVSTTPACAAETRVPAKHKPLPTQPLSLFPPSLSLISLSTFRKKIVRLLSPASSPRTHGTFVAAREKMKTTRFQVRETRRSLSYLNPNAREPLFSHTRPPYRTNHPLLSAPPSIPISARKMVLQTFLRPPTESTAVALPSHVVLSRPRRVCGAFSSARLVRSSPRNKPTPHSSQSQAACLQSVW